MGRNYMSMSTVYTSDGAQVGMAIQKLLKGRYVGVGWMCELRSGGGLMNYTYSMLPELPSASLEKVSLVI